MMWRIYFALAAMLVSTWTCQFHLSSWMLIIFVQGCFFFNLISFDDGIFLVIKLGEQNLQLPIDNHVRIGHTQCRWYLFPWRKNQLHLNKISKYMWYGIFMVVARYGARWKQLWWPLFGHFHGHYYSIHLPKCDSFNFGLHIWCLRVIIYTFTKLIQFNIMYKIEYIYIYTI